MFQSEIVVCLCIITINSFWIRFDVFRFLFPAFWKAWLEKHTLFCRKLVHHPPSSSSSSLFLSLDLTWTKVTSLPLQSGFWVKCVCRCQKVWKTGLGYSLSQMLLRLSLSLTLWGVAMNQTKYSSWQQMPLLWRTQWLNHGCLDSLVTCCQRRSTQCCFSLGGLRGFRQRFLWTSLKKEPWLRNKEQCFFLQWVSGAYKKTLSMQN